jgi:hypothetical protein
MNRLGQPFVVAGRWVAVAVGGMAGRLVCAFSGNGKAYIALRAAGDVPRLKLGGEGGLVVGYQWTVID